MKKAIVLVLVLSHQTIYSQTLRDTINYLKDYSHSYLEYLFNKRNIDSVMSFWDESMAAKLKIDYSAHKQECQTDSTLKVLFTSDMHTFYDRVKGNIDFFACDDKDGENILYIPSEDKVTGHMFLINYDFYGDFESHNLLMRTSLTFRSRDKGKTWALANDTWIDNYMILYYFRKDANGRASGE